MRIIKVIKREKLTSNTETRQPNGGVMFASTGAGNECTGELFCNSQKIILKKNIISFKFLFRNSGQTDHEVLY